jgi:hypothetical protein
MRSKGNSRTASQNRWYSAVAELGSVITNDSQVVLHHPIGEQQKHNKLPVGVWWVVPLTPREHQNLHDGFYQDRRKEFEKIWFKTVIIRLRDHPDCPPDEIIKAIAGYRR